MDNYKTPEWILRMFDGWFDPCPLSQNPQVDGLNIDWEDNTYCNPPYSNPLPWVEKAIKENKKGKVIVMLLKLDCSTKWYRLLVNANAHFLYVGERVKFNGKAPPFCNVMVVLE